MVADSFDLLMDLAKAEGWAPVGNVVYDKTPKFIWPNSEFVFPSRYSAWKPYSMKSPFNKALAGAGIEDFHWHDIRRTVCTHLLMAGVPEKMIMKIQA